MLIPLDGLDEAESLLLAALLIFEAEAGGASAQTQEPLALLVALYEARGEPERAEPYQARLHAANARAAGGP